MNYNINDKIRQREAIIVWLKNINDQKKLYQYGDVAYLSKKLRYVYLYVPKSDIDDVKHRLTKAPFVRKILTSEIPNLEFSATYQKEMMQELHDEAIKINEMEQSV